MKHILIKKISKIHAIKCNKSAITKDSIDSHNTLNELHEEIMDSKNEEEWNSVNKKVNDWAGNNPIATDREISDLMTD